MSENVYNDKGLQQYLKDISKIPTLSREEENRLAIKAKNGDKEALNKLIESNLKFVVRVATKYQNRGLSFNELISEGNQGLIKAIEKFDPDKNIKLISYAVWWIKQRISAAISNNKSMIIVPLGKNNISNKIKNSREQIYQKTGNKATEQEISEHSNIDMKTLEKIQRQIPETISLDSESNNLKTNNITINTFLSDPDNLDPNKIYKKEKLKKKINDLIKQLPERNEYILRSYFGLNDKKEKNFAEIAKELGLSRERIRQIQKESIKKIYENSYKELENDIDLIINKNL
jgi:RNA polymerase primary sigma factor